MSFRHLFLLGKVKLDNNILSRVITTLVVFSKGAVTLYQRFLLLSEMLGFGSM